ncbi:MAG: ABC transporter ATP-binding protein [Candidatus Uhrbacteria bacterium]
MALIEVDGLTKIYGEGETVTPALRGVSFSIESGEFVAIMGPSGSGKSTLLHVLGFLDRASGGTYRFDGKSIENYTADELAALRNQTTGFIFQSFNLLAKTSVLENVMLPLLYSSVPEREWLERAHAAIARVGLSSRERHRPSQLSGGEQQRVAIARALVLRPRVIFADEPTGNLDSASECIIMEILQRLHNEDHHTILLITHELAVARYAGRVLSMRDGRLVADESRTTFDRKVVRDEPIADCLRSETMMK